MDRVGTGILLVILSAVSFGFMPIFARLAYSQGVGVDDLFFVRFLLAFLIMGAILAISRLLIIPKSGSILLDWPRRVGVLSSVHSLLHFPSLLTRSNRSVTSLHVSGLRDDWRLRIGMGESLATPHSRLHHRSGGLFLVANPIGNPIGFGVFLSLGASVTYTIYILSGSKVLKRVRGYVAAFYVMGAASVSFGLTGALSGSLHLNWNFDGWFWVVMITLVCTVIAMTSFFIGLSRIGPSRATLISLVEPVTSILASTWLFGNALNTSQWFGGILILAVTAITTSSSESRGVS